MRDLLPSPSRRLGSWMLGAVFVAVSVVTALNYAFLPGESTLAARRSIQDYILARKAPPPDRHRFLAPVIVEGPISLLSRSMRRDQAFDRVYGVFYVGALATLLWSLFAYVRVWFTDEQTLVGVLFVASTLPITTRPEVYAPYSFLEPTLFSLALLCILRDRRAWLGLLVALAAFNRETGIFIVLLYAVAKPLTKPALLTSLAYAAIWLAVILAVRLFAGDGLRYWTIEKVFRSNLSQPLVTVFNVTALFGVFWWFAVAGFRRAPRLVQRTAIVIPGYLAVIAVWGIWWEVRLLLPLMPLLLPLSLSFLFEPKPSVEASTAEAPGR